MAKKRDAEHDAAIDAEKKRRQWVQTAAGLGLDPDGIGVLLDPPMDGASVEANYATELVTGKALSDLAVLSQLQAGIKKGNMSAIRWWTESQMGWKAGGGPKEKPPETNPISAPTTMPTAASLSAKILNFRRR